MKSNLGKNFPNLNINNFLIERMEPKPICELVVGIKRDKVFGIIVTIGAGGIYVDLLKDLKIMVAPLNQKEIVGLLATDEDQGIVLSTTCFGYGKRTPVKDYRKTSRGSQGVISISTSDRNGAVVGAVLVEDSDDVMLMTDLGMLIRTKVDQIRETGRAAQGVKLINLKGNSAIAAVARVPRSEDEEEVMLDEEGNVIENPATEDGASNEGTEGGTDIENNDSVE